MTDLEHGWRRGEAADDCRGDLLAMEQRGELSAAETLALESHLADCSSCRDARRVFSALADVGGVDPGDAARIERMSNAARRWTRRQGRRPSPALKARKRRRILWLGAVALLLGGSASATAWLWRSAPAEDRRAPVSAAAPRDVGVTGRALPPLPAEAPAIPGVPLPASAASAASSSVSAAAAGRSAQVASGSGARASGRRTAVTPASLLRQASEARRGGDDERATRLYRQLQEDFPRSTEALVASVPLGGLLLEKKSTRAALVAFDAYLGSSRGGALIPEALYGRARALAQLGERQEERRTWERLLDEFPNSAYGPLARRRVAELK